VSASRNRADKTREAAHTAAADGTTELTSSHNRAQSPANLHLVSKTGGPDSATVDAGKRADGSATKRGGDA
jgi:hypothetical protein